MSPLFVFGYIFAGLVLTTFVHMEFDSDDPKHKPYDVYVSFLVFYILWPVGLIVFVIKWYQGKATININ